MGTKQENQASTHQASTHQASKPAGKYASKQSGKQASLQASKQAGRQASTQASKSQKASKNKQAKQASNACQPRTHLEGEEVGETLQPLHASVHVVSQEQKFSRCYVHPQLPHVVREKIKVLFGMRGKQNGGSSTHVIREKNQVLFGT